MGRTITSVDKKYMIVEKDINGVPSLILMPTDYVVTDKPFYKMGGFELFNLVETYGEAVENHKKYWKVAQDEPYDWEVKE